MRKLLVLMVVTSIAGATGCTRGPCGETWRGCNLFGLRRQQPQAYQYGYGQAMTGAECCDPCSGTAGGYSAGYTISEPDGAVMSGATMTPGVVTQAPCCQ